MHYASLRHARRFRNVTRAGRYPPRTLAALFLITSSRKLWKNWCKAVDSKGIEWAASHGADPGWDAYHLEQAALSLACHDHPQVTLYDLTDRGNYPTELIVLVLSALLLARGERTPKFNEKRRINHVSA